MEEKIPEKMKAALLLGTGGPEMLEIRDDVSVPVVQQDQVLVKVSACGLNNTDINTRVGWYSRSVNSATTNSGFEEARTDDATWGRSGLKFPRIQGADISGRIVKVGEGINDSLLGERVLVNPCILDKDDTSNRELAGYLGSEFNGGFAEYCVLPARNVHVIETDLSDIELASFPCSWAAAEHMLQRVQLEAGQSIAITGASGGVGTALIQLAKRRHATVYAVASSKKLDQVKHVGADEVIARESSNVPEEIYLIHGHKIDVVADVVGGENFSAWLELLKQGGKYVTSGAIAGPIVDLDLRTLYLKDLELVGATVFQSELFEDLVSYIERGEVQPQVGKVFKFEEIHEAQRVFNLKDHVGSIVLTF